MRSRTMNEWVFIGMVVLFAAAVMPVESSGADQEIPDAYVIGPEDVLEIVVWKEEDLTREVLVRSDGRISLPLVDDIQAAGLTPLQLKRAITERLKEYTTEPSVSVIVRSPMSYKIYVTGRVNVPGVQVHRRQTTVMQALSSAGGLAESANERQILLIRRGGDAEKRFVIDYSEVVSGERSELNLNLESGDTLVVPERDYRIFVVGNVNGPGTFTSNNDITVLQAIAMAGGLNEWASKKLILISKQNNKETRRTIDFKKVISGKDFTQNLVLKSGDTIMVP